MGIGKIVLMTLATALTSGFVPLLNLEAYLVATAAAGSSACLLSTWSAWPQGRCAAFAAPRLLGVTS